MASVALAVIIVVLVIWAGSLMILVPTLRLIEVIAIVLLVNLHVISVAVLVGLLVSVVSCSWHWVRFVHLRYLVVLVLVMMRSLPISFFSWHYIGVFWLLVVLSPRRICILLLLPHLLLLVLLVSSIVIVVHVVVITTTRIIAISIIAILEVFSIVVPIVIVSLIVIAPVIIISVWIIRSISRTIVTSRVLLILWLTIVSAVAISVILRLVVSTLNVFTNWAEGSCICKPFSNTIEMIIFTEDLVWALLFSMLACADSTIDPLGPRHLLFFGQRLILLLSWIILSKKFLFHLLVSFSIFLTFLIIKIIINRITWWVVWIIVILVLFWATITTRHHYVWRVVHELCTYFFLSFGQLLLFLAFTPFFSLWAFDIIKGVNIFIVGRIWCFGFCKLLMNKLIQIA